MISHSDTDIFHIFHILLVVKSLRTPDARFFITAPCLLSDNRWFLLKLSNFSQWNTVTGCRLGQYNYFIGFFFFSWHNRFGRAIGPGVDSASNRNEHEESPWGLRSGRSVRLITLLPSVSWLCREIWELRRLITLRPSTASYSDIFTFYQLCLVRLWGLACPTLNSYWSVPPGINRQGRESNVLLNINFTMRRSAWCLLYQPLMTDVYETSAER
jgi:hypothetical protein